APKVSGIRRALLEIENGNTRCAGKQLDGASHDTIVRRDSRSPDAVRSDGNVGPGPAETSDAARGCVGPLTERVRLALAGQQAGRDGAVRGSEHVRQRRHADDARADRAGASERAEVGRRLPGHEVS